MSSCLVVSLSRCAWYAAQRCSSIRSRPRARRGLLPGPVQAEAVVEVAACACPFRPALPSPSPPSPSGDAARAALPRCRPGLHKTRARPSPTQGRRGRRAPRAVPRPRARARSSAERSRARPRPRSAATTRPLRAARQGRAVTGAASRATRAPIARRAGPTAAAGPPRSLPTRGSPR